MKKIFLILLVCCCIGVQAQKTDRAEIEKLLQIQTVAWNNGDIEGFMQTYQKSDSLMFIGKSGVTLGWGNTLDNYKKGYPDTVAMGKLAFNLIEIKPLSPQYYFVVGKWMLTRTAGNLSGHFTLLLQKIDGEWKIIADHSS